jgi:hypothetical protein
MMKFSLSFSLAVSMGYDVKGGCESNFWILWGELTVSLSIIIEEDQNSDCNLSATC